MGIKKIFLTSMIFFVAFFACNSSALAADEAGILEIDFSTTEESYAEEDEVVSKIKITNASNEHHAKNIQVKSKIPEELEVLSDDVLVKDNQVIWDIENLGHSESIDLTLISKLKKPTEGAVGGPGMNKPDNTIAPQEEENTNTPATSNVAPQTGDDSNLNMYFYIFVFSLIMALFSIKALRKKRIPKGVAFILALLLLVPSFTTAHAQGVKGTNVQTFTKVHQLTIGKSNYDIKTEVSAEIHDSNKVIPVTGEPYTADNELLKNEQLTFKAVIDGKEEEQVIMVDEEGYFVSRLKQGIEYTVTGNGVSAKVTPTDTNEVKVENTRGEIRLGKTVTNGDNRASFQPSVIYLQDEDAEHIQKVSSDLKSITFKEHVDLKHDDLFVVPELEEYPSGIAFEAGKVSSQNGKLVIQTSEPKLEEVFEEIYGDTAVELSPEYFTPAAGVVIEDNNNTDPDTRLMNNKLLSTQRAYSPNLKVSLNLSNLFPDSSPIRFNGSMDIGGSVTGNIDWKLGLNPIKAFDFNFQGSQTIRGKFSAGVSEDIIKPVKLGGFRIPTQVPGLAVNLPLELVTNASGEVSITVAASVQQEIGLAYDGDSGMRTYPEKKFHPNFGVSDLTGSGSASIGVRQSILAEIVGIDLAGIAGTGSFVGKVSTSLAGPEGIFKCVAVSADFNAKVNLRAPIFNDWESGNVAFNTNLLSDKTGSCIRAIKVEPSEMELSPGETKSITVTGTSGTLNEYIQGSDDVSYEVSKPESISVEKAGNRVDLIATAQAQDGDVIKVKVVYDDGSGDKKEDTLTVTIVDDRAKGELVGKVIDAIEEAPIHHANVKIYSGDRLITDVQTGEDGTYKAKLAPNTYKIVVSYPNYITDTSKVTVTSENATTYDSKLQLVGDEYAGIGTVSGNITNAVTGDPVPNTKIDIRKGKNTTSGDIVKSITADDNGNYEVELPGGNYTMELSKEGYVKTETNILAIGEETRTNQNATMSPVGLLEDDLRVVLTWGEEPRDIDSHFTGPTADGNRFHVYYSSKSYKDDYNDVSLDRDDVSSYGPETVTVIKQIENGTYTYGVHNYTDRSLDEDNKFNLSKSQATVKVYKGDQLLSTYNVPIDREGNVWRVFEIRDGEIVPINQMGTIEDWSSADSFAPVGQ